MNIEEWKIKNRNYPKYAHFDAKVGLEKKWDYITDEKKVAKHGFYPFISYTQVFYKYSKSKGVKVKERPICYSSHIDRCIYQYYGFLLNEKYNEYSEENGFSESAVAYRTNLHKNNIHFAKQAFDFIKQSECEIIVGDFTGFFDNLEHKYLKEMLKEVLGSEVLSNDWYNVFRNITKYSKWDLVDILHLRGFLNNGDLENIEIAKEKAKNGNTRVARRNIYHVNEKIKELNKSKLAITKQEFKMNKKKSIIPNQNAFGIPQGSAISAVLSNVYMISFDKKINDYVNSVNGLYLRYSDDFIVIVPKTENSNFTVVQNFIKTVVEQTNGLSLQLDKTKLYHYKDKIVTDCTSNDKAIESHIDYLGFLFDGKEVTLRQKTISKYYYRMYRKLNFIVETGGVTKNNHKVSYENLYRTYTQKGRNGEYIKELLPEKVFHEDPNNPYKTGNFFSYVHKAQKIFVGEPIMRHTKRHMLKIRRKREQIK